MIFAHWKKVFVVAGIIGGAFALGQIGRTMIATRLAANVTDPGCDESTAACGGHVKVGVGVGERVVGAPRLLVFSSGSCPACKRVAPDLARAVATCSAAAIVDHIDVDEDEGSAIATRYGVSLLPSFVSIDGEGIEVSRLTGVQTEATIEDAISEIRGARCAAIEDERSAAPI